VLKENFWNEAPLKCHLLNVKHTIRVQPNGAVIRFLIAIVHRSKKAAAQHPATEVILKDFLTDFLQVIG
jgi:hypothetical protein